MNNYNFSTLNDKEFEEIAKDLLNKKFAYNLKSFSKGRDKGIDLLRSTNQNEYEIVVQVKHYINSSYSSLITSLNKEKNKISQINPKRYILVVSSNLTVANKIQIQEIFKEYIKSLNDIYSQQDLNDIIIEFPEIEKKYYKLWLSSTNILQNILNNAIESRSKYFLELISKKIKFYVPTNNINESNKILKEEQILLITGQPGIGKTTLAEILIFEKAKNNYKIYKIEDINEAEKVISQDPNEKQLFYFDDFLGANYLDTKNSNINENALSSFVERIYYSKNKYLILTARTIIYNRAIIHNEKLNNSKLNDTSKFELKLDDYNKYEKALILYNHFYFNNINTEYFNEIKRDKFYFRIIEHESYTPRIIEFFSDSSKIKKINIQKYQSFVLNSLDNPEAIWHFSFNNQLEYLERCLIFTLFTFTNYAYEYNLNEAFQKRLDFEKNHNNQIIEVNQFEKSMKILLNGFVKSILYINYDKSKTREYQFLNPSLTDYLLNYVNESLNEKKAILTSAVYLKQLDRFCIGNKITFEKDLQLIFVDKLLNNQFRDINTNKGIIKSIEILFKDCTDINVDYLISQFLEKIELTEQSNYYEYETLINLIENCETEEYPQTFFYIKNNFHNLINHLLLSIDEEYYSITIVNLFTKYKIDYSNYLKGNTNNIESFISKILKIEEENNIEILKYNIKNIEEAESFYNDLEDKKRSLSKEFGVGNIEFNLNYDEQYWLERMDQNYYDNNKKEDNSHKFTDSKKVNYDFKIRKLFK